MTNDERYDEWRRLRPELFGDRADDCYPLVPGGTVRFENQHLLLLDDRVRAPDGEVFSYLRAVAPPFEAPGAAILPVTAEGVVLLDNFRHAVGQRCLEIPRGFGELDERVEECARRELTEELGVPPSELLGLGSVQPDSGLLTAEVALFLARVPSEGLRAESGVRLRHLTVPDLYAAISDGTIRDSFTIASAFRAKLRGLI